MKKKKSIFLAGFCCAATLAFWGTTETVAATPASAVEWVHSKEGQHVDFDNIYGAQCVDLICQYIFDFWGVRTRGNAIDFAYQTLPDALERIEPSATPQPGDIAVFSSSHPAGHVVIVTNVTETHITYGEQNVAGSDNGGPTQITTVTRERFKQRVVALIRSKASGQAGWRLDNNTWYYTTTTGALAKGWLRVDGTWYLFDQSGAMKTGWQQEGGHWYFLEDSGAMKTGWITYSGRECYLLPGGQMAIGWQAIDGHWYYFDPYGYKHTGWLQLADKSAYLETDGKMVTGWHTINGVRHHFNQSGYASNGWQIVDGYWYAFTDKGIPQTGWIAYDGKQCYLQEDGKMVIGQHTINGRSLYFNPSGYLTINGTLVAEVPQ